MRGMDTDGIPADCRRPDAASVQWLQLRFANGKSFPVDLTNDVEHFAPYRPLRDRRLFARVTLGEDGYSVVWPVDELDMGADTLWQYALEQNGRRDAAEFSASIMMRAHGRSICRIVRDLYMLRLRVPSDHFCTMTMKIVVGL